ncbi:MAG: hypothetical protein Q8N91_06215 [Candidatus Omnitrophota bacterium]|nr:hypothetical protein [Candidatus Omnitrophota bacterium]
MPWAHSKNKLSAAFILAFSMAIYAYAETEYKPPPEDRTERIGDGATPLYVGMSAKKLYEIYPQTSQKDYYRNKNEEWIVFDDIVTTADLKDIITVYLVDGKVKGWDKKQVPLNPEERLKSIMARQKQGAVVSGGPTYREKGIEYKEESRRKQIEDAKMRRRWVYR